MKIALHLRVKCYLTIEEQFHCPATSRGRKTGGELVEESMVGCVLKRFLACALLFDISRKLFYLVQKSLL